MAISTRRQRQKEATLESILSSARKIAREDGWGAVTIRRIAEMVEYTPPIVYEYFLNKEALLGELQRIGFAQLTDELQSAVTDFTEGTTERLMAMVRAYWNFAEQQSELYDLMHGWTSRSLPLEETFKRATPSAEMVQTELELWAKQNGTVLLPDPAGAVDILWAMLHGLVTISAQGRFGDNDRAQILTNQAVNDMLDAWLAKRQPSPIS